MELTAEEVRVLGCLVEKELTTPDQYPLSVHALVAACNQKTSRDPVMTLDERAVVVALEALRAAGLAHRSGDGGRVARYAHNLTGKLGLDSEEIAALATLLLRGPQTAGEVRSRCDRLHAFTEVGDVEAVLQRLAAGTPQLVARLERLPGRKEHRYAHMLGGGPAPGAPPCAEPPAGPTPPDDRVARLESEVAALHDEVAALRAAIAELKAR